MRWAWLWIAACAAGCGSDGIFIEVAPPPGVALDRVELVIGDRDCALGGEICEGVQPPMIDRDLGAQGNLWFSANEVDDFSAELSGGSASFQLAVAAGEAQILVLGKDAQGEVVAGAVMLPIDLIESPVKYQVQLAPVEALRPPGGGTPGTVGLLQWQNPVTGVRCVGLHDHDSDRGPVFVLPESDPDCDGVSAERECAPLDYVATPEASPDVLPNCAAPAPVAGVPACVLGNSACDERPAAPLSSCSHTDEACIGSSVCEVCGDATGFEFAQCARELLTFQDAQNIPSHLECTLEVESDKQGHYRPCANGLSSPQVPGRVTGAVVARTCTGLRLASFEPPFGVFTPGVVVDTGNGDKVSFDATPVDVGTCDFTLDWQGKLNADLVDSNGSLALLAAFDLDGNRAVIYPVDITFVTACSDVPKACIFTPTLGDAVTSCSE
jgi:hypothetical protein